MDGFERSPDRVWGGTPGRDTAGELSEHWCTKKFDYAFTAYYPENTMKRLATSDSYGRCLEERTVNYTKERLAAAGYRGWYVISVHDLHGSTLWHPHMMLETRFGGIPAVKRAFRPVADINCDRNGPIINLLGWAGYCAMRACERGYNSDCFEMDWMGPKVEHRSRGSRGRSRGRGNTIAPPSEWIL